MENQEDNKVTLRGYARVCIHDKDGNLVEDSGFNQNAITANGWQYMIWAPMSTLSSAQARLPRYAVLGSVTNQTVINSAMDVAAAFTRQGTNATGASSLGHTPLDHSSVATSSGIWFRLTGEWSNKTATPSDTTWVTGGAGHNINALAIYNTNSSASTNAVACVYFAASNWGSDQTVRVTYDFRFSQS